MDEETGLSCVLVVWLVESVVMGVAKEPSMRRAAEATMKAKEQMSTMIEGSNERAKDKA